MNLQNISERLNGIRAHNHWQHFHNPKNLVMAASVEMAELSEIFQWLTPEQSLQLDSSKREHVGEEMADVFMYLLLLLMCFPSTLNRPYLISYRTTKNVLAQRFWRTEACKFYDSLLCHPLVSP